MVKKFLSVSFAVVLVASVILSGCNTKSAAPPAATGNAGPSSAGSATPDNGAKKKMSIMYMQHWVPGADQVIKKKAEEWGAKNNVEIQFDTIAEKDFEFKITSTVENKTGPDLALFRTSTPVLYQDALLDVSDVAKSIIDKQGEFFAANKAEAFSGDHWVSIPLYSVIATWMYRIDMLQQAGQKVPDTYDDLLNVAKAVNNPSKGVYGFGTALSRSRDGVLFTQAVLWAFGSKLTSEDGKKITFNSPETLAGLQFIVDFYKSKVMPQGVTSWDDSSNNKAWAAGQLAMTTNAPSIYYQSKTNDPKLAENTGHALWPKGPAGRPVMVDTYSLAAFKYSKYPDLAKDLLKYLTTEQVYNDFYTAGQGFQLPTSPKYVDMKVYQDPKIKPVVDMMKDGRAPGWPGPVSRGASEVEAQSIITDMVDRVIVDNLTPKAALDEATKRIEEIYSKYKQ